MAPHRHEDGRRSPATLSPRASMVRLSAGQRLAGAGAILLILWALVYWATR
jgi:hypothetical protein